MAKFLCSYAYNVPRFFDFVVEAETDEDALFEAEKALAAGAFDSITGHADWDNCENRENERVFCLDGEAEEGDYDGGAELKDGRIERS